MKFYGLKTETNLSTDIIDAVDNYFQGGDNSERKNQVKKFFVHRCGDDVTINYLNPFNLSFCLMALGSPLLILGVILDKEALVGVALVLVVMGGVLIIFFLLF